MEENDERTKSTNAANEGANAGFPLVLSLIQYLLFRRAAGSQGGKGGGRR